jgi:hypothetical protein
MAKWHLATDITGGASSLDTVPDPGDYTDLVTGDMCFVYTSNLYTRIYRYDEALVANENIFGTEVIPDGNVSGTGAWKEKRITGLMTFWAGTVANHIEAVVTEAGGVVSLDFECLGSIPGVGIWSDDIIPIPIQSVVLNNGSDAAPTANYVHILKADQETLVVDTEWPATEHVKIAYVLCPSAAYVASHGAYVHQNWNDGNEPSGMGHLSTIGENIRLTQDGAHWNSGVLGNGLTDNYISIVTDDTPDSAYFLSTAGVCFQMHRHTVPAFNSQNEEMLAVNSDAGAYTPRSDIRDEEVDALGDPLTNNYYNIVFWMVANKGGEYAPVMMNMPTGSYNGLQNAINDVDGYDVYDIPRQYKEDSATGFLVCRITFRQTASAITVHNTTDLRGATPGTASGTALVAGTEFADNQFKIFNVADDTKIVDVDLVGITTGNTRTIEIPDGDMIIPQGTLAGSTELYYAGVLALNTVNQGISIFDTNGAAPTLFFYDDDDNQLGWMAWQTDGTFAIYDEARVHYHLKGLVTGELQLYYDGDIAFSTHAAGISVRHPDGNDPILLFETDTGSTVGQIEVLNGDMVFTVEGTIGIIMLEEDATELYFDGAKKLGTVTGGVDITGVITADGLTLGDDDHITFGAGPDGKLYSNGTAIVLSNSGLSENYQTWQDGGAVELYFAGVKKFETTATGVLATGLDTSAANEFTKQQGFDEQVITSSSNAVAWDLTDEQCAVHTLTEHTTISAPSNMQAGTTYQLRVVQAAGLYTLAFNAAIEFGAAGIPAAPAADGDVIVLTFYSNGTVIYGAEMNRTEA